MKHEGAKYGLAAGAIVIGTLVVNGLLFAGAIWLVIYVVRCAGVDI